MGVSVEYFMAAKTGLGIEDLLLDQREDIIAIAAKYGAFNIRVFGLMARGEANEHSDIDFLVDSDLDQITPWFPGGWLCEWESVLGRKVYIVTEKALSEYIPEHIFDGAIAW
jgi:hypothetical protein